MTSEVQHGRHQRPSLIEFLTGGDLGSRHASKSVGETHTQQPQHKGKKVKNILGHKSHVKNVN